MNCMSACLFCSR